MAVVPLGEVDAALVRVAADAIEGALDARVRIEPRRELPQEAWSVEHKRWRADELLEALHREPPEGASKILAITSAEISATRGDLPDGRVGGLAEAGGRNCVVSTWIAERYSKSRPALERRIAELALQELGHTLGLGHCPDARCAMYEGRARPSSGEPPGLCERCRGKLGNSAKPRPTR